MREKGNALQTDSRIDEYLARLPAHQRDALQRLRTRVRRLVPNATETISYGMPAFKVDGHFLLSFAGWKGHCSIYPLTDTVLRAHADTLKEYGRTKGSLHFTREQPLPDAVLEEIVRERVAALERGDR